MNQKNRATSAAIATLAATAVMAQQASAAGGEPTSLSTSSAPPPPDAASMAADIVASISTSAQDEAAATKERVDRLDFRTVSDHTPRYVAGLRVRSCSPQGTFRRAGFAFERDARELRSDELTDKQYAAIVAEPLLVVEHVEIRIA